MWPDSLEAKLDRLAAHYDALVGELTLQNAALRAETSELRAERDEARGVLRSVLGALPLAPQAPGWVPPPAELVRPYQCRCGQWFERGTGWGTVCAPCKRARQQRNSQAYTVRRRTQQRARA